MPENPLLPNAKLKQLYTTMQRARALAGRAAGFEAVAATMAEQLEPGDAVITAGPEIGLKELFLPARARTKQAPTTAVLTPAASPLAFASGIAAAAQLAGNNRLVAALLDTRHPEPAWASLLEQAQRDRLPLIVICPERTAKAGTKSSAEALTWPMLSRTVKKLQFPILTVDGADAVAMYRAMQESVLRARHGDGPALLWCLMPEAVARAKRQPGSSSAMSPIARLESYLAARRIPLPGRSAK